MWEEGQEFCLGCGSRHFRLDMSVGYLRGGFEWATGHRVQLLSERSRLELQAWGSSAYRWVRMQGESVKKKGDTKAQTQHTAVSRGQKRGEPAMEAEKKCL